MRRTDENGIHPGSFRDPSGFVFIKNNILYRQINLCYKNDFDLLIHSRLYQELSDAKLAISYQEVEQKHSIDKNAYKILKPEQITFISYPYEWCFSQLKEAALTTLRIQKCALDKQMTLKDASAYNIQFHNGNAVLIDMLSFEAYYEGEPWVAYRQFCQHFLAPLSLMSYSDVRLEQLLRIYIDGIPLSLASKLLPLKTNLNLSLLLHIHLHAKSQSKFENKPADKIKFNRKVSKKSMYGLIDNLESAITNLHWKPGKTEWGEYYQETNYSNKALEHKKKLVQHFIHRTDAKTVWDLGANNGLFSRIASDEGIPTIAFDIDPVAVEKNYYESLRLQNKQILPLLLDLTNPSPALGWMNQERQNLFERGPCDLCLALALIHHLAISNNLPFTRIFNFFRSICKWLIIEFVPKSDSQVQRLLITRKDIFPDYTKKSFEKEFNRWFLCVESKTIKNSERTLYLLMQR